MKIPISGKLYGLPPMLHLMDKRKQTKTKMAYIQDGQVVTSITSDNLWMLQLGPWSISSKMFQMMLSLTPFVFVALLMVCERVVDLMPVIQAILKILKALLIFVVLILQWLVTLPLFVMLLIAIPINVTLWMLSRFQGLLQRR